MKKASLVVILAFCLRSTLADDHTIFSNGVLYGDAFAPWIVKQYNGDKANWTREMILKDQERIIRNYEKYPTNYSTTAVFPVALAYGYTGHFDKAAELLKTYPEGKMASDEATHLLGMIEMIQGDPAKGISYFQKSWSHGFADSLGFLAIAYARTGNQVQFDKLVPELLDQMPTHPPVVDELVMSTTLLTPFNTNLFLRAIEGVSNSQILEHPDIVLPFFVSGLWESGLLDRAKKLIAEADEKHGEGLINSLIVAPERRKSVIRDYQKNGDAWKQNELLLVAIAYAAEKRWDDAIQMYKKYLKVKPNQKRALRGLGIIYSQKGDYSRAKAPFLAGWNNGDVSSLNGLAFAYLQLKQYDEMKKILPNLLEHKDENPASASCLIAYAANISPPNRVLFDKVIAGFSDDTIVTTPELTGTVIDALKIFGEFERARRLEKMAANRKVI